MHYGKLYFLMLILKRDIVSVFASQGTLISSGCKFSVKTCSREEYFGHLMR